LINRVIPPVLELDLDLPLDASQAYGISIDAASHRSGWQVLTRRSFLRPDGTGQREVDATILRPMLVHKAASTGDFTAAFERLALQGSPFSRFGAQRFSELRDPAKLAFLNLEAKLRETRIGVRSLLSFVRDVIEADTDRVFLYVAAELRSLVDDSPEFSDAPGHAPPSSFPGLPAHPDSWKHTRFDFGNLQLSFSKDATPLPGSGNGVEPCFSVDCDIDLERDLGHAFEFVHNRVFDRKTDQTLVYRMLWDQNILPVYILTPPPGTKAGARISVSTSEQLQAASAVGLAPKATGARHRADVAPKAAGVRRARARKPPVRKRSGTSRAGTATRRKSGRSR
jgi:hypothetical protein